MSHQFDQKTFEGGLPKLGIIKAASEELKTPKVDVDGCSELVLAADSIRLEHYSRFRT